LLGSVVFFLVTGMGASCTEPQSAQSSGQAGGEPGGSGGRASAGSGSGAVSAGGKGSGGAPSAGGKAGASPGIGGTGAVSEAGQGGSDADAGSGTSNAGRDSGGASPGGASHGGSSPGGEGGTGGDAGQGGSPDNGEGGASCDELCPSGTCTVVIGGTDQCLDSVLAGPGSGAIAIQSGVSPCEPDHLVEASDPLSQLWDVSLETGNVYRLRTSGTDFCLTGVAVSPGPGIRAGVMTAPCETDGMVTNGTEQYSQLWIPTCVGPNSYRWQVADTDQCLGGILIGPTQGAISVGADTADCEDDGLVGSGDNTSKQAWTLTDAAP
jgi:hypothetical protein